MGTSSSSSSLGRTTTNLKEEASQPTESRSIHTAKKNHKSNHSPSNTSTTDQPTRSHAASPNDNENQINIQNNNKNGDGEEKNMKTASSAKKPSSATKVVVKDPRGDDPTTCRMTKRESNLPFIDSFDPTSTYHHRPDIRIHVSLRGESTTLTSTTTTKQQHHYSRPLRHDDVVIAPAFFGATHDWTLYHTLLQEMTHLSQQHQQQSRPNEEQHWVAWHEGAHLIVKNPQGSPTYNRIVHELCTYFQIRKDTIGTRFNWYKDSTDWKPLHHDSA
jgi:hypothetical protein